MSYGITEYCLFLNLYDVCERGMSPRADDGVPRAGEASGAPWRECGPDSSSSI